MRPGRVRQAWRTVVVYLCIFGPSAVAVWLIYWVANELR